MTATVTRVLLVAEADTAAEIVAALAAFAGDDHVTWLPYTHGDGTETRRRRCDRCPGPAGGA